MLAPNTDMADGHRGAERLIAQGVDVISAGFPCQDISFAGEGAGLAGSRSGLVWSLLRTIRLVRPRWAVLENVAALLSRGLDQILGHMATFGYDAEWHCIPASAVGAPHRRDRIWIIANPGSQQHESGRPPLSGEIAAELSRAFADAAPVFGQEIIGCEPDGDFAGAREMADAICLGELQSEGRQRPERRWAYDGGQICDPDSSRSQTSGTQPARADGRDTRRMSAAAGWWATEPDVGRMANGVPARVDRLRGLGNAVVPQIPEIIARAILAHEKAKDLITAHERCR